MNFLLYLGAFALALGILIVVHEYGHYVVARWMGVKVLRFSLGFGRPIWRRRWGRDQTEWAVGAFPLGGYVKMLDEREAPVAEHELGRAFNRQSVWRRIAIVAAGPVANFLLAIVFYWALFLGGVQEPRPVFGTPAEGSVAAAAGFQEGELVRRIGTTEVLTLQEVRWNLLQLALDHEVAAVETTADDGQVQVRRLDLSRLDPSAIEGDLLAAIGLRPFRARLPAVIGAVTEGSPAAGAGLKAGDRIVELDGKAVEGWGDVAGRVREAADQRLGMVVERGGERLRLVVVPAAESERGERVGRIGVAVRADDALRDRLFVEVRYGPVEGLGRAAAQTWETATFSLSVLGRMVLGEVSWKNLSGPLTIADYAGQSASMGLPHYIKFLALISISLGVLNLLPIPLLDGGHLLYYFAEIIKGRPISERAMEIGQQVGLALLLMLMAFAFYNDVSRLIAG